MLERPFERNMTSADMMHCMMMLQLMKSPASLRGSCCFFFSVEITETEVCQVICSSGWNKAPGFDGITVEVLVCSVGIFVGTLTRIFNRMLFNDYFPVCWKVVTRTSL